MKKLQRHRAVRRGVQIFFFAFVFILVVLKTLQERGAALPFNVSAFHSICPFGAIESLGRLITQGKFIPKTHTSNFWVLGGVVLLTVLFGRVFCGYICPLGSVQDFFFRIGKGLRKAGRRIVRYDSWKGNGFDRLLQKAAAALTYAKYLMLVLIIVQTTRFVSLTFAKVDPYYALFNFWNGSALPSAIAVLAVVLIASLFVSRPWCRWFCPLGAFLGIISRLSPWKVRRDLSICSSCNLCSKRCPMGIDVANSKNTSDTECIRCGECCASCNVENSLEHKTSRGLRLPGRSLAPLLFALIFLTPVLFGKSIDSFDSRNHNGRAAVSGEGRHVLPPPDTIEIKSSMTLNDLASEAGMTVGDLKGLIGITAKLPDDTKLRDIEDIQADITLKAIKELF